MQFWAYRMSLSLLFYGAMATVSVGLVGNALVILTLVTKLNSISSAYIYLTNLAFSDGLYCIVQVLRNATYFYLSGDVLDYSVVCCKMWHFLVHMTKCISGWTICNS